MRHRLILLLAVAAIYGCASEPTDPWTGYCRGVYDCDSGNEYCNVQVPISDPPEEGSYVILDYGGEGEGSPGQYREGRIGANCRPCDSLPWGDDPVCGSDGETYEGARIACLAGVAWWDPDECPE